MSELLHYLSLQMDWEETSRPSYAYPYLVFGLDEFYNRFGEVSKGLVGFRSERYKVRHTIDICKDEPVIFDGLGIPYVNTVYHVYQNLETTSSDARFANMLFWFYKNSVVSGDQLKLWLTAMVFSDTYDGMTKQKMGYRKVTALIKKLKELSSYWEICEVIVKYVTGEEKTYTFYSYNDENCDLNQDIHVTTTDVGFGFGGLFLYNGVDATGGFSVPIFGEVLEDLFNYYISVGRNIKLPEIYTEFTGCRYLEELCIYNPEIFECDPDERGWYRKIINAGLVSVPGGNNKYSAARTFEPTAELIKRVLVYLM